MKYIVYIGIAIVLFIFCFVLYYYYIYSAGKSNVSLYRIPLLSSEVVMNEDYTNTFVMSSMVTRTSLAITNLGYGYSFVWEMYIPNLAGNNGWNSSFNLLKPIISMNDSPQIGYHPKKNYLSIILKYKDNPYYPQFFEIKYNDMKLQKWSKYILVINGRSVILYIDGNPVINKSLPNIPILYDIDSSIMLGKINNNFNGKIRNLSFYPYPLNFNEITKV